MAEPVLVKKYSNRRLYDTDLSRYVTIDELTARIRSGVDVRVVDAATGEDLTQATLVQIILETPASRLMPAPVLTRLLRMQDDALAEFFGRHVATALDLYLFAKQGAQAVSPAFPFATLPWTAGSAVARLFGGPGGWGEAMGPASYAAPAAYAAAPPPPGYAAAPPPPPPPPAAGSDDVAAMRDEIGAMRRELAALRDASRPAATPRPSRTARPSTGKRPRKKGAS